MSLCENSGYRTPFRAPGTVPRRIFPMTLFNSSPPCRSFPPCLSACLSGGALLSPQPFRGVVPEPRQVVGRGGQGDFDCHFDQTSTSKLPHPALLFQHSKDRFNQALTPRVDRSSSRAPQLSPHRSVGCIPRPTPQAPAAVHHPRQIRIRHISVDLLRFQTLQRFHRKKATVPTDLRGSLPAALLHGLHHRQQQAVIGRLLADPLLHNQVIFAGSQGHRVAQHEAFPLFQKAALRIGPRPPLQTALLQLLQPRRNLRQLFFQPGALRLRQFQPRPLVGILGVAGSTSARASIRHATTPRTSPPAKFSLEPMPTCGFPRAGTNWC
jgi:hypothetical protein